MMADIEPFEPLDEDEDENKFDEWLRRFQIAIDCSAPNLLEKDRVKFLLTKLSKTAFSEYHKHCMPQDITEFTFDKTTSVLRELFDLPQYSLFSDRYECLRISKNDSEQFRNYFHRVKTTMRKFQFSKLNEEQFYCLIALAGIRLPADEAARSCILQRLNADGDKVRYDQVVGDCLNFLKVREATDSSYQRASNRRRK